MKQILIVEDDSFLNKMLAYNLTADGYGVTSALNARTAADAIRQREFDLVLLDINLPDGNGFELCKLIKPQHPDTIVIFLTANDQESDQIRGYEVGAVDYITKPFVIGALQRKIKAMYVEIKVADTGKGISESNQAAIFRRFYREEEVHEQQGVGIGLYLAREIITRQGGYIKVVSEPGRGSEFSIMLPTK